MSLYRDTERKIRRSIHLLSIISLVVVALVWVWLFLRETYVRFEQDRVRISEEYLEGERRILRERVNNVSDFIITYRRRAEARLEESVRDRVEQAHAVAMGIIEANAGRIPETELQRRVVDALRPLRWDGGASYIWINTYDLEAILCPTEPHLEGESLSENETVRRQALLARTQGSGFARDVFRKPGAAPDEESAQISYVRDVGRWGWYMGSAAVLDDFERKLQEELLSVVAQFRYGDNYIFIDTFDGHALLMNGARVDPPEYAWELESVDGVKILQEQLRVARANPEGGFLSYTWYEASAGQDMPYLSFVRTIDDWKWKIGTGKYLEVIEDEIERRRAALWSRTWKTVRLGSAIASGVLGLVLLSSVTVNRRISRVFGSLRHSLEVSRRGLLEANAELERRVREETEKRLSIQHLSITDSLTGLFNRRHFEEVLDKEWRRASRARRPLALIMADIDRFKAFNDALGHPGGDQALVEVGKVLNNILRRAGNLAARYGGEEFAIILPEASQQQAMTVARMIQRDLTALGIAHPASDVAPILSLSMGVGSVVPAPGDELSTFVVAVDQALYAAKRKGGNRIEAIETIAPENARN